MIKQATVMFFFTVGSIFGMDSSVDREESKQISVSESRLTAVARSHCSYFSDSDNVDDDPERINTMHHTTSMYIPKHVDISCCLDTEAKCCFCVARWLLQPLNVILPLASTSLVAAGEYYMKDNPGIAKSLNLAGLICSAADFVTGVLLIKVNNKLAKIDQHFQAKNNNRD